MAVEPFPAHVRALVAARDDLSVAKLGYLAYDPDVKGTNPDTFKSVMAGRRPVTVALVQAVARALDVSPEEFPEYRLALARRQLDEREVGLEAALAALEQFEKNAGDPGELIEQELAAGAQPSSPRAGSSGRVGRARRRADEAS